MREKMEQAIAKLKDRDLGMERSDLLRVVVALTAMGGILLPWVALDGHGSWMTGSEMVAYSFFSPERASLFAVSRLATICLLLVPPAAAVAVVYGFFQLLRGHDSLGAHLLGALLPVLMLFASQPVLTSDGPEVVGLPVPGIGIITTIIAQAVLFAAALLEGKN